ncbi:UNVERIFIED_CONTAM: hypothetical protein NCL1_44550 [Trichonephila clavipes]
MVIVKHFYEVYSNEAILIDAIFLCLLLFKSNCYMKAIVKLRNFSVYRYICVDVVFHIYMKKKVIFILNYHLEFNLFLLKKLQKYQIKYYCQVFYFLKVFIALSFLHSLE